MVEGGNSEEPNHHDSMLPKPQTYRSLLKLLGVILTVLALRTPALAQVPLYTRELHIQHNGSGNSVKFVLPSLTSSYTLSWPSVQGASGSMLTNDGSGNLSWTASLSAIGSTGTTNYVPLFTSATTVGNSVLFQSGSSLGLGTTSPGAALQINTASASTKGLIVRGTSSATANLFEGQNSSGSPLFEVSSSGNLARINNVAYTWPASVPSAAASGTQLGEGILTTTNTGALSWKQRVAASATLDFPNTATRSSSDLTITVTGAASGDMVSLGVPNASVLANTSYTAWVSADNTVTVRLHNYDNADKNPASGTFKVMVFK